MKNTKTTYTISIDLVLKKALYAAAEKRHKTPSQVLNDTIYNLLRKDAKELGLTQEEYEEVLLNGSIKFQAGIS